MFDVVTFLDDVRDRFYFGMLKGSFFNKVADLRPKFLRTPFLRNTSARLLLPGGTEAAVLDISRGVFRIALKYIYDRDFLQKLLKAHCSCDKACQFSAL